MLTVGQSTDAVEAQLVALGAKPRRLAPSEVSRYSTRDFVAGWRFDVGFTDAVRRVDILLPAAFPFGLPRLALVDRPPFLSWPHVERDGVLCLPKGTIDHADPGKVVLHFLQDAVTLVEEILAGDRDGDFADEFLTYWSYDVVELGTPIYSLLHLEPPSRLVRLWRGRRFRLIADEDDAIKSWLDNRYGEAKARPTEEAALIWLDEPITPAEFPRTAAHLRGLASQAGAEESLASLALRGIHDAAVFLASKTDRGPAIVGTWVPKPEESGPNALTRGFRPGKMDGRVLFDRYFGGTSIKRYNVERADASWIHGRGTDPRFSHLRNSAVAILGCGSIGAAVACALAAAGVGRLILIDPDMLTWSNVGRHPLGAEWVGMRKATALASKLKRDFPHIEITSYVATVEDLLINKPEIFDELALAVLATGEWDAEAMFDAQRQAKGWTFPCVYGWTEAHACAGHSVAITYGSTPFAAGFDNTGLPLLRVAEWPDPTEEREPACGAVYQPYGPVELGFIVNMIAELALECVLGGVTASELRVWACRKAFLDQTKGRWTKAWREVVGDALGGGMIVSRPWGTPVHLAAKRDVAA